VLTKLRRDLWRQVAGRSCIGAGLSGAESKKAVVYVHRRIYSGPYEIFGWDHYRTILSLIQRRRGVKKEFLPCVIPTFASSFLHSGGLMPFTFEKKQYAAGRRNKGRGGDQDAMLSVVRQFHYDTAHSNNAFHFVGAQEAHPGFRRLCSEPTIH